VSFALSWRQVLHVGLVVLTLGSTAGLAATEFVHAPGLGGSRRWQLQGPEPADVQAGQAIYAATCASCHGAAGEGGLGPRLQQGEVLREFSSLADLTRYVQERMPKDAPGTLTPSQARAVADYLAWRLARLGPPAPKAAP
jgi:mono/diheme cytochrome c family protein